MGAGGPMRTTTCANEAAGDKQSASNNAITIFFIGSSSVRVAGTVLVVPTLLLSTRWRGNSCGHSKTRLLFARQHLIRQGDCGLPGGLIGLGGYSRTLPTGRISVSKAIFPQGPKPTFISENLCTG